MPSKSFVLTPHDHGITGRLQDTFDAQANRLISDASGMVSEADRIARLEYWKRERSESKCV